MDQVPCGEGDEELCCAAGELCYLDECTAGNGPCMSNRDCADGEYCERTALICLPRAAGEACEYRPEVGPFEMDEEWSWTGDASVVSTHNQIMMAPMVANLTDDNGDGVIDEEDIPDVVFSTFNRDYWGDGILRAISGADGSRLWPTATPSYRTNPGGEVAIAELDAASPGPEILVCSAALRSPRTYGYLMMVSASGELLRDWSGAANRIVCSFSAPAVADMDRDGTPEILVGHQIAHADGTRVLDLGEAGRGVYSTMADVVGDADLELITGSGVYRLDGTEVWSRAAAAPGRPAFAGRWPAVADLDLDGQAEIIQVSAGQHAIIALDGATGDTVWGPIDVNPPELAAVVAASTNGNGGGPVTVANFDDDPNPEIAFAGGFAYVIFEHDGSRKWYYETQDRSSRSTGSSIFDFEGDGIAEVLYNDELVFRVFSGPGRDGEAEILYERCNTSGTLREYPLVVDVDNDDHAEIILMENNYAFSSCSDGSSSGTGLHAFGHPRNQWVRTRRIWNQHSYHVTNINEDATVPISEETNWSTPGLNNFRQNVQPEGIFDAPDLVPDDLQVSIRRCPTALEVSLRVVNRGAAGAISGVPVTFFTVSEGTRTRIGQATTSRSLLPGESELVELPGGFARTSENSADIVEFVAVINDPDHMPNLSLNECRPENNSIGPEAGTCPRID